MPIEKNLSFEDVNAKVEKFFNEKGQQLLNAPATAATLCEVYNFVRPVLVLLSQSLFIPAKWKDILKILIAAIDVTCPQK